MRFLLMICVAAIFATGVLMIFSTTSAEALELDLQHASHHAIIKQLLYAMGGVAIATGVYNLGYRRFLAWSPLLLALFVFFLLLTLSQELAVKSMDHAAGSVLEVFRSSLLNL